MRIIIFFFSVTVTLLIIFNSNIFSIKDKVYGKFPALAKVIKQNKYYYFEKDRVFKNIENDYNVSFLPDTQFESLNIKKLNLTSNFKRPKNFGKEFPSFSIDFFNQTLLISTQKGYFYYVGFEKLYSKKNGDKINLNSIKSNFLKDENERNSTIFDTVIIEEKIYVYYLKNKKNCKTVNIDVADLNLKYFDFKKFFNSEECQNNEIQIGKINSYNHNGVKGILFTVNNVFRDQPENYLSQNINSIFGKTIFIDIQNKNKKIFSYGHRAPQGLFTEGNLILSTEHGPKGGDEINKIDFNKNYGWPIASYGDYYIKVDNTNSNTYSKKPYYSKSHEESGFEEPIYSFVPSIGISEIIRLPNEFSPHFQNNFLVGSLNGKSLYRVKFNKNFSKLIFVEKIFIGNRIRDIKYNMKKNIIVMALEYNEQIALIDNLD